MKKLLGLMVFVGSLFASVDINHASISDLSSLKGIGDAKAKRIISYIKQNGCFSSIDELAKVKGIGQGFISKNKDNITLTPCKKN